VISYKVIVTERADKDEENIFKCISEKFGETYAVNFRSKLIDFSSYCKSSLL
jgi:plasmid stabilization system protein ParE